jgi:hypothetical protein
MASVATSIVLALGGARVLRQRDRRAQARSVGEASVTAAEAEGRVEAIRSFERLAELADKRASEAYSAALANIQRAEARELAAVARADRAEELMRAAVQQASDERLARRSAEARIEELENRIAELEVKIGHRSEGNEKP